MIIDVIGYRYERAARLAWNASVQEGAPWREDCPMSTYEREVLRFEPICGELHRGGSFCEVGAAALALRAIASEYRRLSLLRA